MSNFLFSFSNTTTYSTFVCSLCYIVLYIYSSIYFPTFYLLSMNIVLSLLIINIVGYLFSVVFMIVGAEHFGMSADDKKKVVNNIFTKSLSIYILCVSMMTFSLFTVLFVSFVECVQSSDNLICNMTYGKNITNVIIAIVLLLATFSILMKYINLFKKYTPTSNLFHEHLILFFVCYLLILHVSFRSKIDNFNGVCRNGFGNNSQSFPHIVFYTCFVISSFNKYFLSIFDEHSIFRHIIESVIGVFLLSLIAIFSWDVTTLSNFIHIITICLYIIFTTLSKHKKHSH